MDKFIEKYLKVRDWLYKNRFRIMFVVIILNWLASLYIYDYFERFWEIPFITATSTIMFTGMIDNIIEHFTKIFGDD